MTEGMFTEEQLLAIEDKLSAANSKLPDDVGLPFGNKEVIFCKKVKSRNGRIYILLIFKNNLGQHICWLVNELSDSAKALEVLVDSPLPAVHGFLYKPLKVEGRVRNHGYKTTLQVVNPKRIDHMTEHWKPMVLIEDRDGFIYYIQNRPPFWRWTNPTFVHCWQYVRDDGLIAKQIVTFSHELQVKQEWMEKYDLVPTYKATTYTIEFDADELQKVGFFDIYVGYPNWIHQRPLSELKEKKQRRYNNALWICRHCKTPRNETVDNNRCPVCHRQMRENRAQKTQLVELPKIEEVLKPIENAQQKPTLTD